MKKTFKALTDQLSRTRFSVSYEELINSAQQHLGQFEVGSIDQLHQLRLAILDLMVLHELASTDAGVDDREPSLPDDSTIQLDWSDVPR